MADADALITPESLAEEDNELLLGDLLNRILDKGVVIAGSVTISVADIDLVQLDLTLVLTSVESALRRQLSPISLSLPAHLPPSSDTDAHVPVLPGRTGA